MSNPRDVVAAVWRIESARIVGALARSTGDVELGGLGPGVWPGLRRALDAGVVLVPGDGVGEVVLSDHVARVRLLLVAAATVGTAAAVAVCGLIGFVGIIVPHAIRLLAGGSYRALVPLSIVVGAGFLVLADVIARTALAPAEIPIGVVTAFFGAPFFAVVLRTTHGGSR